MTHSPNINLGLFGLGTVGSQVYNLLHENQKQIEKRLGFPIHVKKVCELDPKKKALVPASVLTTKVQDILDDPEISIIVELIGDKPIAKEIMIDAMRLGKNIVTANKAILATHGLEILQEAAKNDVEIAFEAAVAGAIPILRSIREGFVADEIQEILGIINGTANYILTGMAEQKKEFKEMLNAAQSLGLAEANPTADIEGLDSAHKIVLLTALAYGRWIPLEQVVTEGISTITKLDFEMADVFGYVIKLLAVSRRFGEELEVRVHPAMLPKKHQLASVREAFNAVMIEGKHMGKSVLYGLGAGGPATATAVVADIVEISRNIVWRVPGVPSLGVKIADILKGKLKSADEISQAYYLRFTALDKPGVFAKIASLLGQNHISIASVQQYGREEGKEVPIVVITHVAKEKDVLMAIREIDKLSIVSQKTQLIRIH